MNNNWNDTEVCRQIAAIHGFVVESLSAALLEWVWQGHEYVRAALPHRFEALPAGALPHPTGTPSRWRVQAATQCLDRDREPLAAIRLTWTRGALDRDSLLASAWLIAHEFVCHAQRLPPPDGAPRPPSREDCPFTEGWMDEVAYGLFTARVLAAPARGVSTAEPESQETHWVRANLGEMGRLAADLRRDRYGTGQGAARPLFVRQWELGAQAARVLRRFLASCTSYELDEKRNLAGLAQLAGLSFRIQGATSSPDDLRRVVNGCLLAGQTALSFMKIPEKARLLQLLTQPIPDIAVWNYQVEALCRTFPV